jgi:hypothetical protein
MSEQESNERLPLPVRIQPDPALDDRRAGPFRTIIVALGVAGVVGLVLYGVTRPPAPLEMASTSQTAGQSASAQNTQQSTTTGSGQKAAEQSNQNNKNNQGQHSAKQGAAAPGGAKQNTAQPTTTGQNQAAGERRSDSATTGKATSAAGDKPQPQK